jgi:hypothetical protein
MKIPTIPNQRKHAATKAPRSISINLEALPLNTVALLDLLPLPPVPEVSVVLPGPLTVGVESLEVPRGCIPLELRGSL